MITAYCWLSISTCVRLVCSAALCLLLTMQDPYRCQEITVLKKARSDEARQLLEKVAKQVQPIMSKRRWTVRKLSEFSPRNPGLLGLNVNRGAEVKIRLRPARDDDSFYDWHHILGTMLHELCHNEISPHNAAFYKLPDELWGEAEDLMDKGITGSGQGFDAPSAGRLGRHAFIPLHNPPTHKMADAIRKAAEARAQQAALMPSGPRKLGTTAGSSINHKQLTPAQAAAMAAERRARDNVWCGAEHSDDELEREVGQQTESTSKGRAPGPPGAAAAAAAVAAANGARKARSSAAAAAAAAATPSTSGHVAEPGAVQQQQRQEVTPASSNGHKQQGDGRSVSAQQHQQLSQQQAALQQQWHEHLQQSNSHLQQRRQQPRKRPAPDTVDLTMTDSDDEEGDQPPASAAGVGSSYGATAAAAAAPSGEQMFTSCPCCAAAVQGALDAAVMQRLHSRQGYRQWCARHRREQQGQQGDSLQAAGPTGLYGSSWTCSICTLINPASILVCQACLTAKNVI